MAYLFLSFCDQWEHSGNSPQNLYNAPLLEQYENLQKRLPFEKRIPVCGRFLEECFPSGLRKKYYITCPNFLRQIRNSSDGKKSFLNNVAVRPVLTESMREHLPEGQNVILIGDIYDDGFLRCLKVKGIEFIDENMSSPNDVVVEADASLCYVRGHWTVGGGYISSSVFTPDFIQELITGCYTVPNPAEVRLTYENWNRYFEFRDYYLSEQSKRNFLLDNCEFVDSYAVNRNAYRMNSAIYDDYILDGLPQFKGGDMIVLSEKVEDAEPFPLICLTIDRNKKAFEEAKVIKGNKRVSEEEKKIRSLASDNVLITSLDPNSPAAKDNRGNTNFGLLLRSGYALGDRFRILSHEIPPTLHLEQLETEHDAAIEKSYRSIDSRYQKIISSELGERLKTRESEIEKSNAERIESKTKELTDSFDAEVKENADKEVLKKIEKAKSKAKADALIGIKKREKESEKDFAARKQKAIDDALAAISVSDFYSERNEDLINKLRTELQKEGKHELAVYKESKQKELSSKYSEDIRNEKIASKEELDAKLEADKKRVIDEETILRFSLYFRLGDINNEIKEQEKETVKKCRYIVYDSRAERTKIGRQKAALTNFYSGNVKNPYLSAYLFNPEGLQPVKEDPGNWTWYLSSLNEKQKEAVRKAVASNGVFLLQGPPGTGKTQVIAETVAQMVKKGKKVLISSETHKAIDNVFDRLPKIAEIVPVRLIPGNKRKSDNDYDPKYLVDNFYKNVRTNMQKAISRYENFSKNKEEFRENFDRLKVLKTKLDKNQAVLDEANAKIASYEKEAKGLKAKINASTEESDKLRISLSILRRTIKHIENNNLIEDDDVRIDEITSFGKAMLGLFSGECFPNDIELGKLLNNLASLKEEDVDQEIALLNPESNSVRLQMRISELKAKINECRDEAENVLPGKEEEYEALRKELAVAVNEKNRAKDGVLASSLKLCGVFRYPYLVSNASSIKERIYALKSEINEIKTKQIERLNSNIAELESKASSIETENSKLRIQIKELNNLINEIQDGEEVKEIQESKGKLERDIGKFFKDFEILEPYKNIDDALKIIELRWNELEHDFARKEKENQEKIPMYKEIADYLSLDEVIEGDRKVYTKDLFESANVFGITCTGGDWFRESSIEALSEYNIGQVDIKSVGIDVVIIDEVSKSSFIDLLIPILYGKTVILVGDHRQLPPMYEFAKLRDDDFSGLDENIINPAINKEFTKLNEECFFKTMFEKIPDDYKTMLVQQYRCHEQIMNVFNSFYQNELKLGFSGQNNDKKHNIRLVSNGRTIIEPDKHIYFIDCKGKETHESDSTSMFNTGEAEVVASLLRKINDYFKKNPDLPRLSAGVICTYGDQARKIKDTIKREHVKTGSFKTDEESMIVSTVDDFQGDERDIIILSTVRNPEKPEKSNPGFINAYQRINVALSRARRLLIIVGNRKYLETKGVIDLPDIHGKRPDRRNFHVYEEIISTIELYGKVIDDVDVLDEKEARING